MFDRPRTGRPVLRALVPALVLAAAACASPPQKEMDQAEGAIATARATGAPQYAAAEFTAAEDALRRSHEAVAQRDYRQALNQALDARERAQNAAREAADKKAVARGQAERAITEAELALATAQQRLGAAVVAGFKALQDVITAGETGLQEARSQLQAQRFADALATATPLTSQIRAATVAFDQERTAAPPARPGRRSR
jgi:flagellar hook-basal body complex protein FliE